MLEIERKFLVHENLLPELPRPTRVVQYYLTIEPAVSVRVGALSGGEANLVIKIGTDPLAGRVEYHLCLTLPEARELVRAGRLGYPIEKDRYRLPAGGGLTWEIDRFRGLNEYLVTAEIELPRSDTPLPEPRPAWLADEVTGHAHYRSEHLALAPYTLDRALNWRDQEQGKFFTR